MDVVVKFKNTIIRVLKNTNLFLELVNALKLQLDQELLYQSLFYNSN